MESECAEIGNLVKITESRMGPSRFEEDQFEKEVFYKSKNCGAKFCSTENYTADGELIGTPEIKKYLGVLTEAQLIAEVPRTTGNFTAWELQSALADQNYRI